jgi:hypothetical protein
MQNEENKISFEDLAEENTVAITTEMYKKAKCALSEKIMKDPVCVNEYNYEKDEIIKFLEDNMDIDP